MLKKGSSSLTQDENGPFFPDQKGDFFVFAIKISSLFFTISCTLVGCAGFSDYNDYLEDPPWLGPRRKFSKIGIQRMAKNHQIQGILERNSPTFP